MDQGSNRKHSAVHNFAPTVTKFCVMWEGQALPHDTKFSNCRCEIIGKRVIFIWSLIPGSSWSGLIKAEPGHALQNHHYFLHSEWLGSFRTFGDTFGSSNSTQHIIGLSRPEWLCSRLLKYQIPTFLSLWLVDQFPCICKKNADNMTYFV